MRANAFDKFVVCASLFTALFGVSSSVFSQTVTAAVPVIVNVNATVTITPPEGLSGASGDNKAVSANTETVLNIVLESSGTSSLHSGRMRTSAPVAVSYSHGNVLLKLSPQIYGRAEISLFTVNGRRILNNAAYASQANSKISRPNIAPGVYLLSVKGADGNSHQTKFSHRGGRLNINVAFGYENTAVTPILARMNMVDSEIWTITATPSVSGYRDTSYTFTPAAGENPLQAITLNLKDNYFIDDRDGQIYRKVEIGGVVWMAENLNFETSNSWCYDNDASNCNTYGRLYTWDAAMAACPAGWRLSTNDDWDALINVTGGWSAAGTNLKASTPDWNGDDTFGFSALPGGNRTPSGHFVNVGIFGNCWTATEDGSAKAYVRLMNSAWTFVGDVGEDKAFGFSVRCMRD